MKIIKVSQDYGGYYSGDAPEYKGSLIGSPSVNISNISSQFGDAQKSVDLVNRFDSNLLQNIVYMFNFAKAGVYGVYVPSLDRAVKTQELQKRLESRGYEIVEEDGMLRAYDTKEEKDQETIRNEIQQVYADLESKGGSVLGLNVADTRNEMEQSFRNLQDIVPPEMHAELRQDLMIAHMAATMAHEATHAKGAEDEAGPTQVETALLESAMREIQQKYSIEGELSLRQGASNNWYKEAQSHFPFYPPSGSDLSGRYGDHGANFQAQPDWGMIAHQYQNRAIEEMLGRQYQAPLPPDLSPEHDIYEVQLRKFTEGDWELDPDLIFEELLDKDRLKDDTGYRITEDLLEDTRPQPLMMPLKQASKMTKMATVFGWYNNLEISDGSTIPGLGDRVMAWDDRDECFSEEEDWIKSQPRYNPTYDIKGFYYRWIEPRFKPESWFDSTRDLSNTHPAKRFASGGLGHIVDMLRKIRSIILRGDMKATRIVCSEDMLSVIEKSMGRSPIGVDMFSLGESDGEEIYSCWIHRGVGSEEIEKVEDAIQNNDEQLREIMSKVVGCRPTLEDAISCIMDAAKSVAHEYDIKDVYAIGSYAREKSFGNRSPEVEELEFTSDSSQNCHKFGSLLAEELGEQVSEIDPATRCFCFNHKGVKICFNGGQKIPTIERWMKKQDLDSSSHVLHDICNKDFTINARGYNPYTGSFITPFNGDNYIETVMDADDVLSFNPFIILRALYLSIKLGLDIDSELEEAIGKYAPVLLEKYSVDFLQFAKAKIESLNEEEAQELFKKYELDKILDFGE